MDNKSSNIDIKSLRIGSHILVNGVRARVVRLNTVRYDENEAFHLLVRGISPDDGVVREVGCFVNDDAVGPIAITPELLKELGFKFRKSAGGSWCISDKKGGYFYATVCSDSTCIVTHYPDFGFQSRVVCAYLHELEAFLYLTTQTELIPD